MTDPARRGGRWTTARWRLAGSATRVVGQEWIIAVAFTVGLAALGTALGILPDLAEEGWTASRARILWLYVFSAVALGFLAIGILLWSHRNRLLRRRGTAYIIEEQRPNWTPEEKQTFLSAVRAQFAATRLVPGPAEIGAEWGWPLDRDTTEWDRRVDELVRSFWAVQFNDDRDTANAVYAWAPWPVAMAFGTRAVAGRRGLELQIRQRPSHGRAGAVIPRGFGQPGHTFLAGGETPALTGTVAEPDHRVTLVTEARAPAEPAPGPVVVLLLRTSTLPWGPLGGHPAAGRVDLHVVDGAGLGLPATAELTVHEWRYQAPGGGAIDWEEFPAVVAAASDWILRRAAAVPDATVLLGAQIPQEIGLGLGVHAATTREKWPGALWPLVFNRKGNPLVVPRLRLGLPREPTG